MSEEGWSYCHSTLFTSFKSYRQDVKDLGAVLSGSSKSQSHNSVQIQTTRAQLRSFTTSTRVIHAVYLYCFQDLIYLCVGICLRPQFLFRPGEMLPRDRADGLSITIKYIGTTTTTRPLTRHQGKHHKHDRSSSCPPRRTNDIAESGPELHSSNCVIGDLLSKPKGQLRPRQLHHWSWVFKSIDYYSCLLPTHQGISPSPYSSLWCWQQQITLLYTNKSWGFSATTLPSLLYLLLIYLKLLWLAQ